MLFHIYSLLINSIYLFRSSQKLKDKLIIFTLYIYFSLFYPLFALRNKKNVSFFGFEVEGFDFKTLHYLFGEIFVKNEYYFHTDKKSPVIIDCGSNIGFSVLFFKFIYPGSKIYAFEPDPETFEILKKNIKRNNLKNVVLKNIAISNKNETLNFYIDEKPGRLTMSAVKERMSKKTINVKAVSLSDFINNKRIDFLKMDIEGYETTVLKDLDKKGVFKNIQESIVEYHHNVKRNSSLLGETISLFEKNGFKYQIDAACIPIYSKNKFQDILIYIYRG